MVDDLQQHAKQYSQCFQNALKLIDPEVKPKKRKPRKKVKQVEDDDDFLAAVIAENKV